MFPPKMIRKHVYYVYKMNSGTDLGPGVFLGDLGPRLGRYIPGLAPQNMDTPRDLVYEYEVCKTLPHPRPNIYS